MNDSRRLERLRHIVDTSLRDSCGFGNLVTNDAVGVSSKPESRTDRDNRLGSLLDIGIASNGEVHDRRQSFGNLSGIQTGKHQGLHRCRSLTQTVGCGLRHADHLRVEICDGFRSLVTHGLHLGEGVADIHPQLHGLHKAIGDCRTGKQGHHVAPGQPEQAEARGKPSGGAVRRVGVDAQPLQGAGHLHSLLGCQIKLLTALRGDLVKPLQLVSSLGGASHLGGYQSAFTGAA